MNSVAVHHEVQRTEQDGWILCFQWCTYNYSDGRQPQDGFRFIWRDPQGRLFTGRGQTRIPSARHLSELTEAASRAGWYPMPTRSDESRGSQILAQT
jgi:hypothetical protein